ncbi:MAG: NnrS family protein [Psychrobium sp.]|nr:NnrS family protein [Psychrobium sp.]
MPTKIRLVMNDIANKNKLNVKHNTPPILQLAFRPFFLLSACYGIWLLCRWTLALSGLWPYNSDIPMFAWHAHEFQFGFAIPVVLGFLLTAAQTWTGQPSVQGKPLLLLLALWLIARLGMNLNSDGLIIAAISDSLLLIGSGAVLSKMILKGKKYRNFIFVPLLIIFLTLHLAQCYAMYNIDVMLSKQLGYATSWWFVILISLISSRVIPFFISKAVGKSLDREPLFFTLITQLMILAIFIQTLFSTDFYLDALVIVSLVAHLYRLYLWHDTGIWKNPMLWSLWLSYAFLPLALLTLLLSPNYSDAMHLINIGFIASMIMAFTTRVSLGHTGRKIESSALVLIAFITVMTAAYSRGLGIIFWPQSSNFLMAFAGISWLIALICFLIKYTPILTSARPGGKAG